MMLTQEEKETLIYLIKNEGFDPKDEKFHQLLSAYLDAVKKLKDYIKN